MAADSALDAGLRQPHDGAPADPQHPGRLLSEHLQFGVFVPRRRDVVDEFELPMRLEQTGVRADAVHPNPFEVLGRRDQHVGHRARGQVDDQIVDRIARTALHHVEGQDVGAYRAERHGQ
jgi:hypothetical protein